MKRVFLLLLAFAFLLFGQTTSAQEAPLQQQNVLISCLEPTNTIPTTTGQGLDNFTTSLVDQARSFREENGPVYILASYPIPNFTSKDKPGGDTCEKHHVGSSEGEYWFCADLKGNGPNCPPEMLKPNTEIMKTSDAPRQPEYEGVQCLTTVYEIEPVTYQNGQLTIPWVKIFTPIHNDIKFWGLQIISNEPEAAPDPAQSVEAIGHALKLSSFTNPTATGDISQAAVDCTTIAWDPYGKAIDAYTLEPIRDVLITLNNQTTNGVIKTVFPQNPIFMNPISTNQQGGYNFAVLPGTYFIQPEHTDFAFPTEANVLQTALNNLQLFDPLQQYIERNKPHGKVYNDPTEPIVEVEGQAERRDLILQPKNSNYLGTEASIISAKNRRQGIKQYLEGIVSHPKAIIHAIINGQKIAQTPASFDGSFNLNLPEDLIPANAEKVILTIEKVPLTPQTTLSQAVSSQKYSLTLLPVALSGFVFDEQYKVLPQAKVDLIITGLSSFPYATTYADANGFISLPHSYLPVSDFKIRVTPQNSSLKPYTITISEFKELNQVYLSESGVNLYNPEQETENLVEPSLELINTVKEQTPKVLAGKSIIGQPKTQLIPSPTEAESTMETNDLGQVLFLIIGFGALLVIGIFLFLRFKNQQTTMTSPPEVPPTNTPNL